MDCSRCRRSVVLDDQVFEPVYARDHATAYRLVCLICCEGHRAPGSRVIEEINALDLPDLGPPPPPDKPIGLPFAFRWSYDLDHGW